MSIRGSITIECDRPKCHAEIVLDGRDADSDTTFNELSLELYVPGWRLDDEGMFWCPDCAEPHEREKHDDDGREYADPRDFRNGLE